MNFGLGTSRTEILLLLLVLEGIDGMKAKRCRNTTAIFRIVVLAGLLTGTGVCTKVEPGYVGIKVDNWGSQKGVQDYPLKTDMVIYNPLTEDMYIRARVGCEKC